MKTKIARTAAALVLALLGIAAPSAAANASTSSSASEPQFAHIRFDTYWEALPTGCARSRTFFVDIDVRVNGNLYFFPSQLLDQCGQTTIGDFASITGDFEWWIKGPKWLAASGIQQGNGIGDVVVSTGIMRGGDSSGNNCDNSTDFTILKNAYGCAAGSPCYDNRTDFNDDGIVNIVDYNVVQHNFGQCGPPPLQ